MKLKGIFLCCLAVLPPGFVISLLCFYFHAAKFLGHYPSYDQPDPKDIPLYEYYSPIINATAVLWVISILFFGLMKFAGLYKKRLNDHELIAFVLLSNFVAIIVLFSKIAEWYFD